MTEENKPVKEAEKTAKKASKKQPLPKTVSVKNTTGITLSVGGITVKAGKTEAVKKSTFDAWSRGAYGSSLIRLEQIVVK